MIVQVKRVGFEQMSLIRNREAVVAQVRFTLALNMPLLEDRAPASPKRTRFFC